MRENIGKGEMGLDQRPSMSDIIISLYHVPEKYVKFFCLRTEVDLIPEFVLNHGQEPNFQNIKCCNPRQNPLMFV